MKILGIVTCFNRRKKTVSCLSALILGNKSISFDFIVVDDNSTDGTKEALKKFNNVQVLNGNGELFYSGGMHYGMEYAKKELNSCYDYCLLFNDDVDFYVGSIERLIKYSDNPFQLLVGATCGTDGKLTYGGVVRLSQFNPSYRIVKSGDRKIFCDTFNANCTLIPYNIFLKEKSIDDNFKHAMGDFDYGLNMKKKGYSILVSDFYVGICNDNSIKGTWQDRSLSVTERIVKKESPKGLPTKQWFLFVKQHYGIISACINTVKPFIKILIRK